MSQEPELEARGVIERERLAQGALVGLALPGIAVTPLTATTLPVSAWADLTKVRRTVEDSRS